MSTTTQLRSDAISDIIYKLCMRIRERLPGVSLLDAGQQLLELSEKTEVTVKKIERPNIFYRLLSILCITGILGVIYYVITHFRVNEKSYGIDDVVIIEAIISLVFLVWLAVYSLTSLESRDKRRRVTKALMPLRSLAHVVDTLQLTKDPISTNVGNSVGTPNSPDRSLDPYQLARYLNYSSEMLALIGKVAFLHVQNFDDPEALLAVNGIDATVGGMSAKIWNKIGLIKGIDVEEIKREV